MKSGTSMRLETESRFAALLSTFIAGIILGAMFTVYILSR